MLSDEQKAIRRTGLTATDMSAVMGENPHRSAFDIYVDKVLPEPAEAEQQSEARALGVDLEPWLVNRYSARHGMVVEARNVTFRHPDHAIALATPDGLVFSPGTVLCEAQPKPLAVLEAKSTGLTSRVDVSGWGEEGSDQVPYPYLIQGHWQVFVVQVPVCVLVALIGGVGYREYNIERDEEFCGQMFDVAERFWRDHVIARKPPEPGPSKDATRALERLYARHGKKACLPSTTDTDRLALKLRQVELEAKGFQEEVDALKNRFRLLIAEDYGIEGPWGKVVWPKSADSKIGDWEAAAKDLAARLHLTTEELDSLVKEKYGKVRLGSRTLRFYWQEDFFSGR